MPFASSDDEQLDQPSRVDNIDFIYEADSDIMHIGILNVSLSSPTTPKCRSKTIRSWSEATRETEPRRRPRTLRQYAYIYLCSQEDPTDVSHLADIPPPS